MVITQKQCTVVAKNCLYAQPTFLSLWKIQAKAMGINFASPPPRLVIAMTPLGLIKFPIAPSIDISHAMPSPNVVVLTILHPSQSKLRTFLDAIRKKNIPRFQASWGLNAGSLL
jgi:hypothetical protein